MIYIAHRLIGYPLKPPWGLTSKDVLMKFVCSLRNNNMSVYIYMYQPIRILFSDVSKSEIQNKKNDVTGQHAHNLLR